MSTSHTTSLQPNAATPTINLPIESPPFLADSDDEDSPPPRSSNLNSVQIDTHRLALSDYLSPFSAEIERVSAAHRSVISNRGRGGGQTIEGASGSAARLSNAETTVQSQPVSVSTGTGLRRRTASRDVNVRGTTVGDGPTTSGEGGDASHHPNSISGADMMSRSLPSGSGVSEILFPRRASVVDMPSSSNTSSSSVKRSFDEAAIAPSSLESPHASPTALPSSSRTVELRDVVNNSGEGSSSAVTRRRTFTSGSEGVARRVRTVSSSSSRYKRQRSARREEQETGQEIGESSSSGESPSPFSRSMPPPSLLSSATAAINPSSHILSRFPPALAIPGGAGRDASAPHSSQHGDSQARVEEDQDFAASILSSPPFLRPSDAEHLPRPATPPAAVTTTTAWSSAISIPTPAVRAATSSSSSAPISQLTERRDRERSVSPPQAAQGQRVPSLASLNLLSGSSLRVASAQMDRQLAQLQDEVRATHRYLEDWRHTHPDIESTAESAASPSILAATGSSSRGTDPEPPTRPAGEARESLTAVANMLQDQRRRIARAVGEAEAAQSEAEAARDDAVGEDNESTRAEDGDQSFATAEENWPEYDIFEEAAQEVVSSGITTTSSFLPSPASDREVAMTHNPIQGRSEDFAASDHSERARRRSALQVLQERRATSSSSSVDSAASTGGTSAPSMPSPTSIAPHHRPLSMNLQDPRLELTSELHVQGVPAERRGPPSLPVNTPLSQSQSQPRSHLGQQPWSAPRLPDLRATSPFGSPFGAERREAPVDTTHQQREGRGDTIGSPLPSSATEAQDSSRAHRFLPASTSLSRPPLLPLSLPSLQRDQPDNSAATSISTSSSFTPIDSVPRPPQTSGAAGNFIAQQAMETSGRRDSESTPRLRSLRIGATQDQEPSSVAPQPSASASSTARLDLFAPQMERTYQTHRTVQPSRSPSPSSRLRRWGMVSAGLEPSSSSSSSSSNPVNRPRSYSRDSGILPSSIWDGRRPVPVLGPQPAPPRADAVDPGRSRPNPDAGLSMSGLMHRQHQRLAAAAEAWPGQPQPQPQPQLEQQQQQQRGRSAATAPVAEQERDGVRLSMQTPHDLDRVAVRIHTGDAREASLDRGAAAESSSVAQTEPLRGDQQASRGAAAEGGQDVQSGHRSNDASHAEGRVLDWRLEYFDFADHDEPRARSPTTPTASLGAAAGRITDDREPHFFYLGRSSGQEAREPGSASASTNSLRRSRNSTISPSYVADSPPFQRAERSASPELPFSADDVAQWAIQSGNETRRAAGMRPWPDRTREVPPQAASTSSRPNAAGMRTAATPRSAASLSGSRRYGQLTDGFAGFYNRPENRIAASRNSNANDSGASVGTASSLRRTTASTSRDHAADAHSRRLAHFGREYAQLRRFLARERLSGGLPPPDDPARELGRAFGQQIWDGVTAEFASAASSSGAGRGGETRHSEREFLSQMHRQNYDLFSPDELHRVLNHGHSAAAGSAAADPANYIDDDDFAHLDSYEQLLHLGRTLGEARPRGTSRRVVEELKVFTFGQAQAAAAAREGKAAPEDATADPEPVKIDIKGKGKACDCNCPVHRARADSQSTSVAPSSLSATSSSAPTYDVGPHCPICLDEYASTDLLAESWCGRHSFHEKCLKRWAKDAKSCPMCREKAPARTGMSDEERDARLRAREERREARRDSRRGESRIA
ncbi:hypothetical protein BDZ90DRAFT_234072 [Jaminaea rosea]|uniref:RING-type domain-containing protein n=1 Tax=Jaminaea rosea TaxID=1569628 RepID=A0A316ULF8_9BASI|nr:hypothetical protein BDZ90DRAFT_234072 [Jaminaea rosea]PWN25638.1 hypothetical protein BDZ90DRAFT_234072 [Jaminaea rosea]